MFDFTSIGIDTHGRNRGQIKTTCPNCSRDRKKAREKCLSVNLDDGVFQCHHCLWTGKADLLDGKIYEPRHWERPRKVYTKPEYKPKTEQPSDKFFEWFVSRSIPADVVLRNRIERRQAWMPQTGKEEPTIAFPYFRDGEVVNVKYRTADKAFRMEKDAELCLYGLDDIEDNEELMFVEGELDKLACEVAGFRNCVSVPNGADTNLDCLANDAERLRHVKKCILAVDNDAAGKRLESALVARLGRDRCCLVEFPFPCKDANEVLMMHGKDTLAECLDNARPIPIEGVFEINDIRDQVLALYENGVPNGVHPGWDNLNEHYRPRLGTWTAVIAMPGSGKTAWLAALMINLAIRHDWKFGVFPAENLPAEEYASMLAEIYIGLPFNQGPTQRMSRKDLTEALDWIQEHFVIFSPKDEERDLDSLIGLAKAYCLRRGINGVVIDPWNELDHLQPQHQTETQYVASSLIKLRQFSKSYNVHTWVVVHPTKLAKDKDGKYPVPTLYDASGSAHWRNKCDFGISIFRHFDDDAKPTEIHIQKVRWKWCGKLGMVELYFDKLSGRYSERPTAWGAPHYDQGRDGYEVEYR